MLHPGRTPDPPIPGPPVRRRLDDLVPRLISAGDTVALAPVAGPADGSAASVFYEVWEPGGAQPDNAHADSPEIFVVLRGSGVAHSDGHVVHIAQGDVLLLPAGSVHRIVNTSPTERLYAVTIMVDDAGAMAGGFARLVEAGIPVGWTAGDRDVLAGEPTAPPPAPTGGRRRPPADPPEDPP